ncbi:type II restriction endonuclease [Finegoldia sp. BIOML-A1]|uniref:type II restriction endonuclease n=1 Tax=Finegoldia sp. BIOML-A1 TaxID=2584649 RepID=UPI0015621FF4|nr:type II restriction endonuclease [Finegoldia sp. BIOML-A1]
MDYYEFKKIDTHNKINYFLDTLSLTNRTPEYYVNWKKVTTNTREFEIELNTLNYLIGKDDILNEARNLFNKQPDLLRTIPILLGCRDRYINVLFINENEMNIEGIDFNNIDITNIERYIDFINESGLFKFMKYHANRSLVDYVYGVETGIDSNARKNRSGKTMESILTKILKDIADKYGFEHLEQATSSKIYDSWGIKVPVDKSARRFDGALFNPFKNKVYVFETNYYGGGGSKLKSVAGEFRTLNNLIESSVDDVTFIWITDGQGWKTSKIPMEEAMESIEHIYNLKMIEDDYLECVLEKSKEI